LLEKINKKPLIASENCAFLSGWLGILRHVFWGLMTSYDADILHICNHNNHLEILLIPQCESKITKSLAKISPVVVFLQATQNSREGSTVRKGTRASATADDFTLHQETKGI